MAYTLKSSALTAKLVGCLIVDEDGETVVDLCGNPITVHANVTIESGSWKSVSRPYFKTTGTGSYTAQGVIWDSPRPELPNKSIGAVFCAMAGIGPGANARRVVAIGGVSNGLSYNATTDLFLWAANIPGGSVPDYNTTPTPDDWSVPFSIAGNYHELTKAQMFYGLESGSLALEADADSTHSYAFGSTPYLHSVGGYDGQGRQPGGFYCVCIFGELISLAEAHALHNDWFGTLIDTEAVDPEIVLAPDPAAVSTGGTRQMIIERTVPAPAGAGVTYNLQSSAPAVATVPSTVNMAAGLTSATFDVTGVSVGATTITATNAADSGETDSASVSVAAQIKLKLLAHVDALGATDVKGAVFHPPAGGAIVGAKIGEFSGAAFGAVAEGGMAPLLVNVEDFDGEALNTSDTPVVVWEGTSATGSALGNAVPIGSVGPHECTVVEA